MDTYYSAHIPIPSEARITLAAEYQAINIIYALSVLITVSAI